MYVSSFFGLFTSVYFLLTLLENRKYLEDPVVETKNLPSVDVIVPAYNEGETIQKTVKSLLELDYPREKLNIYVVDDGSDDNTLEVSKKFECEDVTVFSKPNGGKASALNYALKRSNSDFVASLDADSFVEPGALKKMVGYFDREIVTAVTPSLKVYEPKGILQRIQYIEYLLGIFLRKNFAFLGSIHVTPGPFTVYRRDFFLKHGGYDENNLTEDIEVALRMQHKQFRIENSVNAGVYTVAPNKWKPLFKQRLRWYVGFTENVWRYKSLFSAKHGQLGLLVLPASFLSVVLVIMTLFYMGWITLEKNITALINYHSIDFDFWSLLKLDIDPFFINLNTLTVIGIVALLGGIIVIWSSKIIAGEKRKIKLSYLLFMVLYWAFFALWWLVSWTYKATGKKVTWSHKSDVKAYRPDIGGE